LEGVENRDLAHAKGRELVQRVAEPCDALHDVAPLRASVGVALFPCDGTDAGALMAQADRRMYRAKGRRVLWSVFRRG
jgi:GGDEF domain-containing protein